MALDIKTLGGIIQSTRSLVDDIRGAGVSIEQAAAALDHARTQVAAIPIAGDGRLAVAFGDKPTQTAIMAKILKLQAKVDSTTDLLLGADFNAQLADEFFNLANSTNSVISSFVTFTTADTARISDLIRQATLDTQQRKRMAAVLQGAVSVLEAGLKIAATVAA